MASKQRLLCAMRWHIRVCESIHSSACRAPKQLAVHCLVYNLAKARRVSMSLRVVTATRVMTFVGAHIDQNRTACLRMHAIAVSDRYPRNVTQRRASPGHPIGESLDIRGRRLHLGQSGLKPYVGFLEVAHFVFNIETHSRRCGVSSASLPDDSRY